MVFDCTLLTVFEGKILKELCFIKYFLFLNTNKKIKCIKKYYTFKGDTDQNINNYKKKKMLEIYIIQIIEEIL